VYLPQTWGVGNVDWQQRINWDELRKKRLDRAHKFMAKHGIGSALIYHHDRQRYLTSLINHPYALQTPKRPYLLIRDNGFPYIPVDKALDYRVVNEDAPWLAGKVLGEDDLAMPMNPTWYYEPERAKEIWSKLAKQIKVLLKKHGVLDLPMSIDYCTPNFYHALKAEGVKIVDGNAWIDEAGMVKFDEEILLMKTAASIQEGGYAALCKDFRIGMNEEQAYAIAVKAVMEQGGEYFEGRGMRSGDRTAPRRFTWGDRKTRPGEFLTCEIIHVRYLGYMLCYDRTFFMGRNPSEIQKEIYATAVEMQDKFGALLKPGMTTHDLAKLRPKPGQNFTTPEQIRKYRSEWANHYGGVGIAWNSAPYCRSLEDPEIVIEKNMTIAYHCFFWLGGDEERHGGVAIENTYLVTDTGCEALNKWPYEDILCIGM
jgi:Xaa-Pro aminopeptidase